jgi:hypothetical protein
LNHISVVLTEDFNPGAVIEGVRFVDPFADDFRLQDWGVGEGVRERVSESARGRDDGLSERGVRIFNAETQRRRGAEFLFLPPCASALRDGDTLLKDDDWYVRRKVSRVLRRIGTPEALAAVRK